MVCVCVYIYIYMCVCVCVYVCVCVSQGGNLIYLYLEVWFLICKMCPYECSPESLKINPYWSKEIRKRPIMEYDNRY